MSANIGNIGVLVIAVILISAGNVFAGVGARNISTSSATAYLSGGGRYAETEDADTPLNNPAGAAFMDDGLHIHLSAMVTPTQWELTNLETGKVYKNTALGPIPDFAITYKKNDWAVFQTVSFPGGTGGGDWDRYPAFDLVAGIQGPNVTAENQKFEFAGGKAAIALGGAYRINDMFSVGYTIKALYANQFVDAEATFFDQETGEIVTSDNFPDGKMKLDMEADGWGLGHSLCMLFNYDKLKIGLRYDPESKIKVKRDIKSGDDSGLENGSEIHDDLPAALFTGVSYQLTPKLKVGGGFIYYWQEGLNGEDEPITEDWTNAWEAQGFVEYHLTPKWELLAGANFATPGLPNEGYSLTTVSFADAWTFTLGTQWRPIPRWTFILGLGYSYYPDEPKTENEPLGRYERSIGKEIIPMLFGVEYKM